MLIKRSDIIQHNAHVLLHQPDAILRSDSQGRLYTISKWNFIGRFINWIYDSNGQMVQNAALKTIKVMNEKFTRLIDSKEVFFERIEECECPPSKKSKLLKDRFSHCGKDMTDKKHIAVEERFSNALPPDLSQYQLLTFERRFTSSNSDGQDIEETYIEIRMAYTEFAVYIANLPLFNKNFNITTKAIELRNYSVGIGIETTTIGD